MMVSGGILAYRQASSAHVQLEPSMSFRHDIVCHDSGLGMAALYVPIIQVLSG